MSAVLRSTTTTSTRAAPRRKRTSPTSRSKTDPTIRRATAGASQFSQRAVLRGGPFALCVWRKQALVDDSTPPLSPLNMNTISPFSAGAPAGVVTARMIRPDTGGTWAEPFLDQWRDLSDNALEPNAFYAPEMLLPSLRHLLGDHDVRIFTLWSEINGNSRLRGLAPVAPESTLGKAPMPNISTWQHMHGFLGTPLIVPGWETPFWSHFCETIADTWWGGLLRIRRTDANGPSAAALRALCVAHDIPVREVSRQERAFLTVPADPAAYLAEQMRGKKRKELRRQRRRLEETGNLTLEIVRSGAAEVDRFIADFHSLEGGGWKGESGTAIAQSDAESGFFEGAIRDAAEAGHLLGLVHRLDDRPVAILVNLLAADGCFSFKTAYDEALSAYSPGVQIQIDNMTVLADAGIRWSDSCAAKDHPMINSVWGERRTIADLVVAQPGTLRRGLFTALGAGETIYRRLRNR
ncbi:GNAT family N-acetyltransferase [Pelagovum pacificum]|uniref:GNAT family N-acetyltransferase n=1 Tax=Pelagovum pacificum TaxID=2588711 RepID=A0A5C5GCQ6_9RHOB|nr:GNAT family N-acetyltransferase [Pelagovum pacificum]QQA41257.1 GNAT family N-acetyltransferase [Pelagovum pacificum]TNY31934.1 GNAT family N-acetyltransferase [Pelagovum pacificum]